MSKWIPDLQPRFESDQRTWMEWLVRNFERLSRWTGSHVNVSADPHPRYAPKGYGGITKQTDTNYGTVGSGDWTLIDNWDEGMVVTPVGVTQDVANSGLRLTAQGVYTISANIAVSFTDTNQGRVFGVRAWNETKSTAGRVVEYFVGRNQDGVNMSQGSMLFEIGANEANDLLQLQISGLFGDSFSNVVVIDALFSAVRVG